MEYDLTLFEKGLEELGIALSQEQKKQFITYYEYLVEKNKVMNRDTRFMPSSMPQLPPRQKIRTPLQRSTR